MTPEQAVDALFEGLLGPDALDVKLRERRGLDRAQLARVEEALHVAVAAYAQADAVPRRLAGALFNLESGLHQGRVYYSDAEQDEIQDALDRLSQIAWAMFEWEDGHA